MNDNMIISKDPAEYEDGRIVALLNDIEAVGIEECLMPVQLEEGQTVKIAGTDSFFEATGPGILFIAYLPLEALDGEEEREGP
jgi:hypothetical protein